jgi:hypothetical protein
LPPPDIDPDPTGMMTCWPSILFLMHCLWLSPQIVTFLNSEAHALADQKHFLLDYCMFPFSFKILSKKHMYAIKIK